MIGGFFSTRIAYSLGLGALLISSCYLPPCTAAADSPAKAATEAASDKDKKASAETLSPENINKIMETGDEGDQYKVTSFVNNNDVTVQTWTDPKSTNPEHDYKINSVLMAKKLIDAFPGLVKVCKVRYYDRNDRKKYTEITVVPGVVKSFAAGIMSEDDLLQTLPMTINAGDAAKSAANPDAAKNGNTSTGAAQTPADGTAVASASTTPAAVPGTAAAAVRPKAIDPSSIVTVLPGAEQEQRAAVLTRIKVLEKNGVKAPAVRALFATMEEQIRDGREAEAHASVSRLGSIVGDMERNYQRAKATKAVPSARTGGTATASSSTSSSSSGAGGGDMEEGIAFYKKTMGDFYPHYGPLYVDRFNIANQLIKMQRGGKKVDAYRQPFLQMEAIVINGGGGLEGSIKKLNKDLELAEAPHDEEYKFQQDMADKRKGIDVK